MWSTAAVIVAAAVAAGLVLSFSTGGSASTKKSATRLLRDALSAAGGSGSFHYVSVSTSSTSSSAQLSQQTVGDAGQSGGSQVITIAGDTFSVVVLGTTAYFRGDASAMAVSLGVPGPVAQQYAGKWISLVPGDAPYQSVEIAVTSSSALQQNITFTAAKELGSSKVDGKSVVGIQGPMAAVQGQAAHGTATLYVAASGRHLPVRYTELGSVGTGSNRARLDFSITFSKWGEAVSPPVPSAATPFSALGVTGGPGPSGPTFIT